MAHGSNERELLLQNLKDAGGEYFLHKPGAAVISARRAGTTASMDVGFELTEEEMEQINALDRNEKHDWY